MSTLGKLVLFVVSLLILLPGLCFLTFGMGYSFGAYKIPIISGILLAIGVALTIGACVIIYREFRKSK